MHLSTPKTYLLLYVSSIDGTGFMEVFALRISVLCPKRDLIQTAVFWRRLIALDFGFASVELFGLDGLPNGERCRKPKRDRLQENRSS